jgi:hypothetical protein
MPGKFVWKKFAEVDVNDIFFESLKGDYAEFTNWFQKKSLANENALVFNDEQGVGAFIYLKRENEPIELVNKILPASPRLKIGTLKLSERTKGVRLGEGAIGVSLWYWQKIKSDEVYVTVFDKHSDLVSLLCRFGFVNEGKNRRGESVYVKRRSSIDYSDLYKSFPFIDSNFTKAGIIPINENFHDRLFPYSELKNTDQDVTEETAGNGITKVYIGSPYTAMHYSVGEPVFIYRRHTGNEQKTYKSAITSFCTITKIDIIKDNGKIIFSLNDFVKNAGNKTVFTKEELSEIYNNKNVVMLEMVYNGFFGKGKNIIHKVLNDNGLFQGHPYEIELTKKQSIQILEMGGADVQNIIIN